MPLKEINYDETHFYRIVCRDLNVKDCYVGHTTDFYSRKCRHKSNCNNTNQEHYKLYVYEFIRENGGWENWDMILIKTEKCNNELEARARERYYIEMFKFSLNSIKRPYTSAEEKDNQIWIIIINIKKRYLKTIEFIIKKTEKRE